MTLSRELLVPRQGCWAGWSDEALYDAITVCALFNFFNRWVDASGVHEMSAEAHEASGKRLAQFGYVPTT